MNPTRLCFIILIFTSLFLISLAQIRSGVAVRARRRLSTIVDASGRPKKVPRDGPLGEGVIEYRFRRNVFQPALPYYRLDRMPDITQSDRFRGNPDSWYYDYYKGL